MKSYKFRKSKYKPILIDREIDLISEQVQGINIQLDQARISNGSYTPKLFVEKLRNIENLISLH